MVASQSVQIASPLHFAPEPPDLGLLAQTQQRLQPKFHHLALGLQPCCPKRIAHQLVIDQNPAWFFFPALTGPITNIVLPEGSRRSNVRAPHSSSFGGRRVSTFALHSR